ncbi:hypothetical protein [Shewanella atlantica]|uniref:hypothetical protein n=1 Tax=Shewanella atlantica TaxID=271099 RepID=UPI0037364765
MLWFIGAFLISTAILMFAPVKVTTHADSFSGKFNFGQLSLLILPVGALGWLLVSLLSGDTNSYGAASIGFVLTACSIALPKFHKFIIPCAAITAISLLIGVAQAV